MDLKKTTYTVSQAAKELGVTTKAVYQQLEAGKLKEVSNHGIKLLCKLSVDELAEKRKKSA